MTNRLMELSVLLNHKIPQNDIERCAKALLLLEDQMTENREHLTVLLDQNIIDSEEFAKKLTVCFEVFLVQVSDLVGHAISHEIYL